MPTGTYDISSLLAVRDASAAEYGLDTIQRTLEADLAAHNQIVREMIGDMADMTTDRQRKYGTSISGEMAEVDEYGRSATQRAVPGSTVGFPLKLFQFAIGWTEKWLQVNTPADMAAATIQAQQAHVRRIRLELKKAIYHSTNYTFSDFLIDKVDLAVKRLVNADGANIPDGPNGETFDGATHTHYLARAGGALAATDITGLINHVVEHGHGNQVRIAISTTDEATVRALAGFTAYQDPRLILPIATSAQAGQRLDITRLDNRAIGIFGAAEIWVKPWAIANYGFCWDAGSPMKPIAFRQRNSTALQGLRIAASLSNYPLLAQYMEAEMGFGIWNRTNGAVLFWGDVAYADPTITA